MFKLLLSVLLISLLVFYEAAQVHGQPVNDEEKNNATNCTTSLDCPDNLACVHSSCVDICQSCGINTRCSVVNNNNTLPICFCKAGYSGNPLLGCELNSVMACNNDSDCPLDKSCIGGKCSDPCQHPGVCGNNTLCNTINHSPVCHCKAGYTWSSSAGCFPEGAVACKFNSHCSPDRACQDNLCLDPCEGLCGNNTVCKVVNHVPACSCSLGHFGDPFLVCHPQCLVVESKNETDIPKPKVKTKVFSMFFPDPLWDAKSFCYDHHDQLAKIESNEDLETLKRLLNLKGTFQKYWTSPMTVEDRQFIWTSKRNNEGFVNKFSVRSSTRETSCLVYDPVRGLTWRDEECLESDKYPKICQDFKYV